MTESEFQLLVKKEIEKRMPEATVIRGFTGIQGFPDILVLYKKRYAVLEAKLDEDSNRQPNQEYWIEHFGKSTYSRFIFPGNKKEVLDEMEYTLHK